MCVELAGDVSWSHALLLVTAQGELGCILFLHKIDGCIEVAGFLHRIVLRFLDSYELGARWSLNL